MSKDFALQGGDRERGDGTGGTSIFQNPRKEFPNELNSRLRFAARGILATTGDMGNGNSSQFFITLSPNVQVDRTKHTIFGKVVGETIYNLAKANDFQVDADTERPLFPPTLDRIEVVEHPFVDVRPRPGIAWNAPKETVAPKKKVRNLRKKNVSLLSFGAEGEEDLVGGMEGGNTLTMMTSVSVKRAKLEKPVETTPVEQNEDDEEDDNEGEEEEAKEEKVRKTKKDKKKTKKKKKKESKPKRHNLGLKPLNLKTVHVDPEADRSQEIAAYNEKKLKLAQLKSSKSAQAETADKFAKFRESLQNK